MRTNFTVSLAKIISEFSLETLNMPANPEKIQISTTEVNRGILSFSMKSEYR